MYTGSPIYQHRSYSQSSHFFYNLIEEHEKNYPHYHTKNCRYAFNGMEQDKEVSGNGNSYTTQFRQYDPRLGRWKSLDPLAAKYASISPYAGMGNNPMFYTDPLGLEPSSGGDKKKRKIKWFKGKEKEEEGVDGEGGELDEVEVVEILTDEDWARINKNRAEAGLDPLKQPDKQTEKPETGLEFKLFKMVAYNYDNYSSPSDFNNLGQTVQKPGDEKYWHPMGLESTGDRVTTDGTIFAANNNITHENFSDVVLGGMVNGSGPENYYFGPSSEVTQVIMKSGIVSEAMKDFIDLNEGITNFSALKTLEFRHYSMSPYRAGGITFANLFLPIRLATPEQFVGGAAIKITPAQVIDGKLYLYVTVYNVTSVGSGNVNNGKSYPKPIGGSYGPFMNTSQTFDGGIVIPFK